MVRMISSLIAGLIFGLGLIISGMVNPAKVQNFLDITGTWDPSLAFVMGAALLVTALGYALVRRRSKPLFEPAFQIPQLTAIDARLLGGAALFGAGWGMAGFCPGPAITAAALVRGEVFIFLAAMVAGIALWRWVLAARLSPQRI